MKLLSVNVSLPKEIPYRGKKILHPYVIIGTGELLDPE